MSHPLKPLSELRQKDFETTAILKAAVSASRRLAELKGVAGTIPNQAILVNTLAMQEAKDSSAIENIVTTHDELFKSVAFPEIELSVAAKEVRFYTEALQKGYELVGKTGLLKNAHIIDIQGTIERNAAGFRTIPGTELKNPSSGRTVYVPPDPDKLPTLMRDLESFINDDRRFDADPLVKMAIIHHQFESIHPFYDGNGRTGRIINVLYLVMRELLDIPVLYLSRHIVRTKGDYYRLLQAVREKGSWEEWVLYILGAVEQTSAETIGTIGEIRDALMKYKNKLRSDHKKLYSQDLVNNLFQHPYTKIEFLMDDLDITRITAAKYLDTLADAGLLRKHKLGRSNYYMNVALMRILVRTET